jgi:hypothetical protein
VSKGVGSGSCHASVHVAEEAAEYCRITIIDVLIKRPRASLRN